MAGLGGRPLSALSKWQQQQQLREDQYLTSPPAAASNPTPPKMNPAVVSSQNDRELVEKCLLLGAADFLCKPLRHNELSNLWVRVWWWQRVSLINGRGGLAAGSDGCRFPPQQMHCLRCHTGRK
jgi:hypothetical protein